MHLTVRKAAEGDLDWILGQLRIFSLFFGSKLDLYDEQSARQGIRVMLDQHILLVCESDTGVLTGMIGGYLGPHPWNPKIRTLTETFWWVADEFRGSRAGLLLLNKFISLGRVTADWISCSLEAESPVNERTLLRRGFRLKERTFFLEVA